MSTVRSLGFIGFLAVFSAAVSLTTAVEIEWNYDDSTGKGPPFWGGPDPTFATCGTGMQQSPVDITGKAARAKGQTPKDGSPSLICNYQETPLKILNNGHTVEVEYEEGSHLEVDGETFDLLQFHFHTPSEHTKNGRGFSMEAHLVHISPSTTQLAVVGVLLKIGRPHPLVAEVMDNAASVVGEVEVEEKQVNVLDLLPKSHSY